jgi:fumarylpyruvate hydrolase
MTGFGESSPPLVFEEAPGVYLQVQGSDAVFPVHRIYCVGRNYREHAREMGESTREPPFFFSKPGDAVCTEKVVPWPPMTDNLHHEVEMVVALGSGGVDLSPESALLAVFGYAVGVDLTRRDLQSEARKQGRPWTTAKAFDHSAPISAISPASEIGHPGNSVITLSVNEQQRQQADISDMTWSVAEIIAELSRYFELKPGDLIFTGTPAGVAALEPGDRVHAVIHTVGELGFEMGKRPPA